MWLSSTVMQNPHLLVRALDDDNRLAAQTCCCLAWLAVLQAAAATAGQWYPPVRSTLLLLSKLYRCIDTKIFAGLAQEAVAACTACVQVRRGSCSS